MRYVLYTKSKNAWDGIIYEIKKAKKSIYLETYIFDPDTQESHDFLGILKSKAQEGLHVVIVADSFGSPQLKKEVPDLKESGIEVVFFSHWLRHIHRKIYIIDERIIFLGGVNIGKRFANWNDLQLKLTGRKITKSILKSFSYTYGMSGGQNNRLLELRKQKISYKFKFWLVEHWPQRNIHTLRRSYEKKISAAKKSIKIVTPYFAPPRWLISLLDDAIKRGVEVEIMLPKNTDPPIMDRVNSAYLGKLGNLGANFYITQEMNHAKVLLIDEREALVGSQNIDPVSFSLNFEAGIFFNDEKLVDKLLRAIDKWKKDSVLLVHADRKKNLSDHFLIFMMSILRPIL